MMAISEALKVNTKLKSLNVYRNLVDVDGARSLEQALKVNSTLEFLDVGHNRLREKGIKAITQGFIENPKSALTGLSIRYNFISDDGFADFFKRAVIENKSTTGARI